MGAYDLLQRKTEKLNNGLGLKINEKKKEKEFVNSAKGHFPSDCKIRTLRG